MWIDMYNLQQKTKIIPLQKLLEQLKHKRNRNTICLEIIDAGVTSYEHNNQIEVETLNENV